MPQERENTGKRLLEVFLISLYLGLSSFGGAGGTSRVLPCRIREKQEIDNGRAFQRPCGTLPISSGSCQQPGRHSDWSLPGGLPGAVLAWIGFTLPSSFALFFAYYGFREADPQAIAVAGGFENYCCCRCCAGCLGYGRQDGCGQGQGKPGAFEHARRQSCCVLGR